MSILKDLVGIITEQRGSISFQDPDRDVGAVDREAKARDDLAQREKTAEGKWEMLIKKLKGKVRSHITPSQGSYLRDKKPYVTAVLPNQMSIGIWRSIETLEFDTPLSKQDHREPIRAIWKKHGLTKYDTDFMSFNDCPVNKFNGISIGYYSSLNGDEGDAIMKATVETVKYLKMVLN